MLGRQTYGWLGIVAVLGNFVVATALAGGVGCEHCGVRCPCNKVCRLVCEEKEVEVTCWGCKCEDVCIPQRSQRCRKHCEIACGDDTCGKCNSIGSHSKKFVWYDWIPGCARTKTRKRLMRKTVTRKVPTYRWVVEDLCPRCKAIAPSATRLPGVDVPPRPPMEARSN